MLSAISSSFLTILPVTPEANLSKAIGAKDNDGDNDGSKMGEIECPKASTGSLGTIIKTSA